nr:ribonuclease H-like domain-containing protein [Tanacetum cinerariifolium]
ETLEKKNTTSTQDLIVKEKMESQSETIQTVSALKLPMPNIGDYDLWSMRMEQYLTHTDYALWESTTAWNTHTLIMQNKFDLDTLGMDDLYNKLKVYEAEIKGQSSSSSNSQNVAFVSSYNTSSTIEAVNTTHNVSAASS